MHAAAVLQDHTPHKLWVTTENAREMYQTALGAHADQSQLVMIILIE